MTRTNDIKLMLRGRNHCIQDSTFSGDVDWKLNEVFNLYTIHI